MGTARTTYAYTAGTNRIASYTSAGVTTTVATNANGNITSIPPANSNAPATFAYNVANRLASVSGSPLGANFGYDGFGQRYSKQNPGSIAITYTYDQDGHLIEENNNGAVADYIYLNGVPVALFVPNGGSGTVYYIHTDQLGTPQLVTDSSQTPVWSMTYQPYGTTGPILASITQNLRLPGQYIDGETGFHYNGFRDYMPGLGRYLEADLIGLAGGTNSYLYANAKPDISIDPYGLDYITVNAYGGLPGPVGISVNGGPTWGYYGRADGSSIFGVLSNASDILSGSNGQGMEVNDSVMGDIDPSDSVTIPVTPAQAQAELDAIRSLGENPGQYNLYSHNCATVVEQLLTQAGRTNVPSTNLPFFLVTELQFWSALASIKSVVQTALLRYFFSSL